MVSKKKPSSGHSYKLNVIRLRQNVYINDTQARLDIFFQNLGH